MYLPFPCSSRLQKLGALDVSKVVHEHQGWRLITCMWLHGGVFHLLANMLSLLVIGIRVEQEFGFGKVLILLDDDMLSITLISYCTQQDWYKMTTLVLTCAVEMPCNCCYFSFRFSSYTYMVC